MPKQKNYKFQTLAEKCIS